MSIEPTTTKDRALIIGIVIILAVAAMVVAGTWRAERAHAWLGASLSAESTCVDSKPVAAVTVTGDDEHDATVTGDISGDLPVGGTLAGEVPLEPAVERVINVSVTRVGGGNKTIPLDPVTVTGRTDCAPVVEPPPTDTPDPEPVTTGGHNTPTPNTDTDTDTDTDQDGPTSVTECGLTTTTWPDGSITYTQNGPVCPNHTEEG